MWLRASQDAFLWSQHNNILWPLQMQLPSPQHYQKSHTHWQHSDYYPHWVSLHICCVLSKNSCNRWHQFQQFWHDGLQFFGWCACVDAHVQKIWGVNHRTKALINKSRLMMLGGAKEWRFQEKKRNVQWNKGNNFRGAYSVGVYKPSDKVVQYNDHIR